MTPRPLDFELKWLEPAAAGSAAEATRGRLVLRVAGRVVWGFESAGHTIGAEWTWVDLLEHLARSWAALEWEQADPVGIGSAPWDSGSSVAGAEASLEPDAQMAMFRFRERHDLATALGGTSAPSVWILREGRDVVVRALDRERRVRWHDVAAALEGVGDHVAARLRTVSDPRASEAVRAWAARADVAIEHRAALVSGLGPAAIARIVGTGPSEESWDATEPVLVAARMMRGSVDLDGIVGASRALRAHLEPIDGALDVLGALALDVLESAGRRPYEQGARLASWYRDHHGVRDDARVDPRGALRTVGVEPFELDLATPRIDAIACWGSKSGVAIGVNRNGRHAQGRNGERTTLAHELCHLLVDRAHALPVAEVMGGHAPKATEQRANAFAASLLLPARVAGEAFGGTPDVPAVLDDLGYRYGVSRDVIAWQALRSNLPIKPATFHRLADFVGETAPRFRQEASRR